MSSSVCHFKPHFPVLSHFVLWPFLDSSSPHPQPSWTVRHIHVSHQSPLDVVFPAVIGLLFAFCFWMQVLVFVYIERHNFGFEPVSLSDPDHTAMVIQPFHLSDCSHWQGVSSYMVWLDMLPSLPFAELSHCSTLKGLRWEIRTGVRSRKSSIQLLPLQKTDVSSFPLQSMVPAGLIYQIKKLSVWVQWVLISLYHCVWQRYPAQL